MHIVYICSPNRKLQLLTSLGSILTSGTQFERITIYYVGTLSSPLVFSDDRILVEEKPDIGNGFWMANKIHLASADGEKVIFIDTDTIVLQQLDLLYQGMTGNIAGRLASATQRLDWDPLIWEDYLRKYNAKNFFPYLNTGLLMFNNGANKLLDPSWFSITKELKSLRPNPFRNSSQYNQHAFSLACGVLGLSYCQLSPSQHAYGWEGEDFSDTVVYHTGNRSFWYRAIQINKMTGILNDNPLLGRLERIHIYRKSLKATLKRKIRQTFWPNKVNPAVTKDSGPDCRR